VIFRPHRRKKNQRVMNRRQSTSILGKPHPENHKGEGNRPRRMAPLCLYFSGMRCSVAGAFAGACLVVRPACAAQPVAALLAWIHMSAIVDAS
jgi:hypothetical protein